MKVLKRIHAHPVGNLLLAVAMAAVLFSAILPVLTKL